MVVNRELRQQQHGTKKGAEGRNQGSTEGALGWRFTRQEIPNSKNKLKEQASSQGKKLRIVNGMIVIHRKGKVTLGPDI